MTALRTGMRQGELIGLQRGDVDWNGKFVEVRRTNYNGDVSSPKSGKPRRVDISDGLAVALTDHRRVIAAEALKTGARCRIGYSRARRALRWKPPGSGSGSRLASRRRGCGTSLFHALRHSYASALIALGESLAYIRATPAQPMAAAFSIQPNVLTN